jgi:hypothetical protein
MANEAMQAPMEGAGQMPAGTPPAQPAGQPMATGEMQQASPEEQQAYEQFVGNGMKLMYAPSSFPRIVEMLQPDEGQDPKEALAIAAATVVSRVIQSAEQAGKPISGDVMLHGGTELFEELADLATKVGAHDFANDPDAMEGALFIAMDQLRTMMQSSGQLDGQSAQEEFGKLQQMSESGELETMLRGLAKGGGQEPTKQEPAGLAQAAGVQ